MNSENGDMVKFSGYNLENIDNKEAQMADKEKKETLWKNKMLGEAEKLREANAKAKHD